VVVELSLPAERLTPRPVLVITPLEEEAELPSTVQPVALKDRRPREARSGSAMERAIGGMIVVSRRFAMRNWCVRVLPPTRAFEATISEARYRF
jgi:hypothetical protein